MPRVENYKENLETSIYCPYCQRYTYCEVLYVVEEVTCQKSLKADPTIITIIVPFAFKRSSTRVWWMGICNNCHKPVLILNDGAIVYPSSLPHPSDERIPEHIRKDLDEAKLCFSIGAYRACVVMSRRALQSTCLDKGASKNAKLVEQIEELASKNIITNDLKDWATTIRWVGNDAAHPGKEYITKDESEDILKLTEQFLHIIYITPAIAKELKQKREKKTNETSSNSV